MERQPKRTKNVENSTDSQSLSHALTLPEALLAAAAARERQQRLAAYYKDVWHRAYGTLEGVLDYNEFSSAPSSPPIAPRQPRRAFLDFPGEVRNAIYRHVFVREEQLNGICSKLPGVGLLLTCQQIHAEASSILYGENSFSFGLVIDWRGLPEILLAGFPPIAIWPAPRYHPFLKRLWIKFDFKAGKPTDLEGPSLLQKSMKAMREAYDSVWDDLDITFDFTETDLSTLTFTMAWAKFRFFAPIAHTGAVLKVAGNTPKLISWCLDYVMRDLNPKETFSTEQLRALREASEIAEDSHYIHNVYLSTSGLAQRLAWGAPWRPSTHQLIPLLALGTRQRIYSRRDLDKDLHDSLLPAQAKNLLMEDNEMRVFAALAMPAEMHNLGIKDSPELRIYFALQEYAMKITAMTRSLENEG